MFQTCQQLETNGANTFFFAKILLRVRHKRLTCTLATFTSCLAAWFEGEETDVERECCKQNIVRFDKTAKYLV